MDAGLGRIAKKELEGRYNKIEGKDDENHNYDRIVFTNCRNVKPRDIQVQTSPKSLDWQVGFFDADREVYFDEIDIWPHACFSSLVRNYWWNGKEGDQKREGYYSLIKSIKELKMEKEHVNDLLDYVEGRYEVGEHWEIHELDRNIEVIIEYGAYIEETVIERLSKYLDNIWCDEIRISLKTENNITCNCDLYWFEYYEEVIPEKLVVNTSVWRLCFEYLCNEVHIPEIVMEEKADLESIIQNEHEGEKYSLLPHVKTLVIRNNPKMLSDLVDYINGRYKIDSGWKLCELNKNIKIRIEKPGITFDAVKEILDYFTDVLVDNNKPEEYLARQQLYQKQFQEHFNKYDLETDQIGNFIPASQWFNLEGGKFNVGNSSRQISKLYVNQKLAPQQFICFHDTDKPVIIDRIIIKDGGDLRCVLQNAYYNGTDAGFFSLLQTAKELVIRSYQNQNYRNKNNQVIADLADYIEGKYVLNPNWKQEELDKDMKIRIDDCRYDQFLDVARRLREHFSNVSIDCIYILLKVENVIDQECQDKCIFIDSRKASPQKLIINAKLMGRQSLILFEDADDEVHIPEITIDEHGRFATIIRNYWENNKEGDEKRFGNYSLVQYVKMLTIRNNPKALKDLTDYLARKYESEHSSWKLQQFGKDIKIVIENPGNAFLHLLKISKHFQSFTVDGKQANDYIKITEQEELKNPNYKAFKTCFEVHDLRVYPPQYGVESQKVLYLVNYIYNIRNSVNNIDSLIVRQKLDINQFVCFHDIDKPINVNELIIDDVGNLRSVLQNAYYSNGQGGFFSLLKTAKNLEIRGNVQAVKDLGDYIDGKYTLHPKWGRQVLDKDMELKLRHDKYKFPLNVAKRLGNYFRNVSIDYIQTLLETENVIDQEFRYRYIFDSCRNVNPEKLVVNAKTTSGCGSISFNNADSEICIPEITIGEHGGFDVIVRNQWQNGRNGSESKYGDYSLVSHVETLTIQNNPKAVRDLDSYVSGNYEIQQHNWKVQKLRKNIIVRINGVEGLDEQINRLNEYFCYMIIDERKQLSSSRQQMLTHINLKINDIRQKQVQNNQKQQSIDNSGTSIQDAKRRIERARDRLGRRRTRFQEYLALAE